MPIVTIEAVAFDPDRISHDLVRRTADAIGQALGVAPGKVWVRLRALPKSSYAQSGVDAAQTPEPVFVQLLRSRLPGADQLEADLVAVTQAVAACLGKLEQDVHVEFMPHGLGRIALGGRVSR